MHGSNQMPNWLNTAVAHWLEGLAASVLLSYGAGFFTHYMVVAKREAATRRRAFRGFLRGHLQKFEAIANDFDRLRDGEVLRTHQASVATIADECAKAFEDIARRRRAKFDHARRTYCGLQQDDVEPYDIPPPWKDPAPPQRNYERGRQRIVDLLKQMIKYAE
jgi:hypothetical protein